MKLIISVLLIAVLPLAIDAAPDCKRVKYDYYVLTMTWPSTFCKMSGDCKSSITDQKQTKFIVHGLWPNTYGAKSPEKCCRHTKLDPQIGEIKGLREIWPAVKGDMRDEDFWSYEYNKHGTCAQEMKDFSPKKYFEEATRLVKELNLDQALTNAGYGADDDKNLTGPSKNLLYRLQDHYHKKPKIRCAVIDGQKAALEQIQFCYDKNLQMIDCEGPNLMCRPNMVVPSFKAASGLKLS